CVGGREVGWGGGGGGGGGGRGGRGGRPSSPQRPRGGAGGSPEPSRNSAVRKVIDWRTAATARDTFGSASDQLAGCAGRSAARLTTQARGGARPPARAPDREPPRGGR